MMTAQDLYVDLLKKSLLEELYAENEVRILYLRDCLENKDRFDMSTFLRIDTVRAEMYREYTRLRATGVNYQRSLQNLGFQHTMIGRQRLENVEKCLSHILRDEVRGDCIECGVWRGGTTIFMRGFLAAHGVGDKTVWVADSFAGLPPPSAPQDAGLDLGPDKFPMLAVGLDEVRDLFRRYSLLDGQVRFLEGWFKDTLPDAPIQSLSLLRVDGDLYESTMDALDALYHKVTVGGFVIIDDYGVIPQCKQAVDDFRAREAVVAPIEPIDGLGVFWRKTHA